MENQNDNQYLGKEKITKLLLKFSIPCILSLLISSLYNIVDQIFIGHSSLGPLGNAATGVVFPITIIAVAFAWCFGDGTAAFLSLCQGRKDTKNADKSVGNSIVATLFISIILVILGFAFKDSLLTLFGASTDSITYASDYFTIILCFFPIYMLGNTISPIIRADGSPKFSSICTLSGAITNIILDPIFIFGFKMGIKGAAWATIIGQLITCLLAIIYLFKTKTFKLKFSSFKMNFNLFSNVLKLGISTFITQMSIVAISLACNRMLAVTGAQSKYGIDIPIATIGIAMKVFTIVINIVVGIILGAQPILGYNYGAKNYKRVKETFKKVIIATIIVGLVGTFLFEVTPGLIISIFGGYNDPARQALYSEFAILTFRIFLLFIVFTCSIKVVSIFFQAVGEPIKAAIVSLVRDIVIFIPLVIILPSLFGVKGCLMAAPIADCLGIILTIFLVAIFFKKMDKQTIEEQETCDIKKSQKGVIITISRQHGTQGKYIGELVAKSLNIPYYYKELTAIAAKDSGLDKEFINQVGEEEFKTLYLTTSPAKYAIEAQDKVIRQIADNGSCVIVGRAADYVLRDYPDLVKIFIYAPTKYRLSKVMEMYNDSEAQALKNIKNSDKARSNYYHLISNQNFGDLNNYDICIDASIGAQKVADLIVEYVKKK